MGAWHLRTPRQNEGSMDGGGLELVPVVSRPYTYTNIVAGSIGVRIQNHSSVCEDFLKFCTQVTYAMTSRKSHGGNNLDQQTC